MGDNKMFIIIGIVGLLAITFSNLVLKLDVVATIISIVVIGILVSSRTKIILIFERQFWKEKCPTKCRGLGKN
ncbi:hypothetical protein AP3564_03065 [Aeribacillus pallidus]|uniref:Uncharacterized protein n=1 Tax=Aeribacillus pallidus TaxID=33936 RepID=A0A223E2F8_9BACI|nr:hypothetical protein AP3564_03065 [Aeribacillus pallidus]